MLKSVKVFLIVLLLLPGAFLLAGETYTVDPVHSSVLFKAKRQNVVNVYGRFNGLQGTVNFEPDNPSASSVAFEINAEAVDTNNERRDNHLRSPDFFNAKQFPTLTFKSTSIKKVSDNRYQVTGDLSLHGVTKSIVTEVEHTGSGKQPERGTSNVGFETTFKIKRSDFGMTFMPDALSDEIQIILAVHAVNK